MDMRKDSLPALFKFSQHECSLNGSALEKRTVAMASLSPGLETAEAAAVATPTTTTAIIMNKSP